MLVTYDPEANATYVSLSDAPVARTEIFGDSVTVDVDTNGEPVGVELLMAPATVTRATLRPAIDRFPALAGVRDALERLVLPATA